VISNNEKIGIVKSVQNFGASDLLEIQLFSTNKTEFFVFNDATVPEVNIEKKYLRIITIV
jgi:ribosomal 30S subunit maturation factor RimM